MSDEVQPVYAIPLWTPGEAARECRMAEGTFRNLGKKRGPKRVVLGGRVWYRPEAVRAWIEGREK